MLFAMRNAGVAAEMTTRYLKSVGLRDPVVAPAALFPSVMEFTSAVRRFIRTGIVRSALS
jgi:hypothetical protein